MTDKPKTGAMRFGDDWTGIFLRGDHAHVYALAIQKILETSEQDLDIFHAAILERLTRILEGSVELGWTPENDSIQMMLPFEECVKRK